MSDSSTKTLIATFETREAADLAIEHLVQQHGIDRADVFVRATDGNSSGLEASGGDAPSVNEERRDDAQRISEIEVSADIRADQVQALQRAFGDADALRVTIR